jgi:hypothetical protein
MMKRRQWIRSFTAASVLAFASAAFSQEDPGKTNIGKVNVSVYYATDGEVDAANQKTEAVPQDMVKRLQSEERLRFTNYRMLGKDVQPLLRSYESWAQPLKPSDEVLVRFEARSLPTEKVTGLDLELWLSKKKVLKMDAWLEGDRPLIVLGPEWRGGRLIIAVSLVSKGKLNQ